MFISVWNGVEMGTNIYFYRAKKVDGTSITGKYEVDNLNELIKLLREKGYYLISYKQKSTNFIKLRLRKVTAKDMFVFCKQVSSLIHAGISISQCLHLVTMHVTNKELKNSLIKIEENIQKGYDISKSMKEFNGIFSDFIINMVRIGEETGALELIFERLSQYYFFQHKNSKKIKTAMLYPAMVLTLIIAMLTFLMTKIIPEFADTIYSMGGELPYITVKILNISLFMRDNLVSCLVICSILIISVIYIVKFIFDRVSFASRLKVLTTFYRKALSVRFSRNMSILYGSGVNLVKSLEIISTMIGNKNVKERLVKCVSDIKEGKSLNDVIKNIGIFDPLVISMITIGEETGELGVLLEKAADILDEELNESIERMITLIQPFMIIILALFIGIIMSSVMLPMLNIMDSFGI